MRSIYSLASLSLLAAACNAQAPAVSPNQASRPPEQVLPLTRVRLYASGIGYFERRGDLRRGQETLPVPSRHLDDALKSLVILGQNPEDLTVSFPSRLSPAVARARAGLPASEEAALSYDRVLAALRGERVRLVVKHENEREKRTIQGRVMEVVAVPPTHPAYEHGPVGQTLRKGEVRPELHERLQLVLLSDESDVLRLDVNELSAVRPLDPKIAERFKQAMSARIASRSRPTQWLELLGADSPLRAVELAYLAEAPAWRTSYRLLVGPAQPRTRKHARLQAWALIHNDTDEPWQNVQLELAGGQPNSFLFPLAAPRYHRRDLETPEDELSSVPQLSTGTADSMWGDFSDYQGETVAQLGSHGASAGLGQGFGSGHGRLGGRSRVRTPKVSASVVDTRASGLVWLGDLVVQAGVVPKAKRTVSVFKVKQPLNVPPQHSAALPFLSAQIAAHPIVWFSSSGSEAERAISINNNTANTFPAGPITVYRDGGFLGEAMLGHLQPGGRQFARIGSEPDVMLARTELRVVEKRLHVEYDGGTLRLHTSRTRTTRLTFRNSTGTGVEAYVGLSMVTNGAVEGSDRVDYDSTSQTPFAVFQVSAGGPDVRQLTAREARESSLDLERLSQTELSEFIADRDLPQRERDVLRAAMEPLKARDAVGLQLEALKAEISAASTVLERLKSHEKSLGTKDSGEAHAALMSRILQSYDELGRLRARQRSLRHDHQAAIQRFASAVSGLQEFREEILERREQARQASRVQAPGP